MSIHKELSYDQKIERVKGIQFSVLSPDDIVKGSVVEVTKTDTYAGNEPVPNGLFDPRMGILEHNSFCRTCEQKKTFCPGHFGHIKLARPVYHPMFYETTRKLLKCICYRCSRLLISPTQSTDDFKEHMRKILLIKNHQKRWEQIFKLCNNNSKIKKCGDDGAPGCGAKQPSRYVKEGTLKIMAEWKETNVETIKKEFTADDTLTILQRVTEGDMEILGFNPKFNRPEWMICTVLPVPPPPVRPSIIEENGQRREDDLTHKLCDIIKTNNQLRSRLEKPNANEEHLAVITGALQYHIATLIDNQMPGIPPAQQRNGRKLKSVADRLKKKEGRIRGNLNGKRVDQSARSVITPDPYISLDQLGVPIKIAMNLTFRETVNRYNIDEMKKLVRNGPEIWPGAKEVCKREDGKTYTLKYGNREKIAEDLVEGDVVNRHLRDDDYVLFNRQPSLHKMSMMCHRVKVMPYQTFRLNVLVTSPYNADFDGDEMNLHMPQSIQTMSELKDFASVPYHIIGPKDGKPIIEVVQDTMVGSFRLTKDHVRITDKTFANLQMVNSYFNGVLPKPADKATHQYTGLQASSQIFPPGFHLELKNKLKEKVIIQNGVHKSGILDKNIFHSMSTGVLPVIYHDYSPFEVRRYLDNLQRLICRWLLTSGFSVGISDLVVDHSTQDKIKLIISSMKTKAYEELEKVRQGLMENNSIQNNQDYFEQKLIGILNGATGDIEKNGLESVHHIYNRMMNMVQSGSKGKPTNVAQMIACVGQQNVDGKRVAYGFTDRTLPHYCKYDDGPEARGFVGNSFISGLTPQEMFFHAMGGREGLIDTAVKSVTGDTPIIVIENGKARDVDIGDWIDKFMDTYPNEIEVEEHRPDLEFLRIDDKVEVYIPTGDGKGKVTWELLTAVTRHDPTESVYEVETAGGRKMTVADSESLLIWNEDKQEYIKKHSSMVCEGDFTPVVMNLPGAPEPVKYLDMSVYFPKTEYVHGSEFSKCVALMREAQGDKFHIPRGWYEENNGKTFTLPYTCKARVQRVIVRSNIKNMRMGCIYPYHATREHSHLPDKFELDYENGVFVGLYLADGCFHELSGTISISKDDLSVQKFVTQWFDKYGITHRIDVCKKEIGTSTSVIGSSTLFARFFKELVGHGARNKYIPDVAYNAPLDFVKGLLSGYFSGDGCIHGGAVTSDSVSRPLTEGISFLCSRVGVFGKISTKQLKSNNLGTIDIAPIHTLSIRAQWAQQFAKEIDLIHDEKNRKLKEMKFADEHRNFKEMNDTVMDPIVRITKKSSKDVCAKMYDVTVPSTLNFVTRNGTNLSDTSETGYIQRRLVKAMEDSKVYYDQTVRNANESIVQFLYGEDGMEGTKIEAQNLSYIDQDIMDIEKYHRMYFDEDLKFYLTEKVFNDTMKDKKTRTRCEAHFNQLLEDRLFLIEKVFKNQKTDRITYPIPFERLIKNAVHRMKDMGLESLPSNLHPGYVMDQIEELIDGKTSLRVVNTHQGMKFLHVLLRLYLSPKPMIYKYHMQKETFDWIISEVRRYFKEAICNAGEMVGIIAAQSLGEPATQLSASKSTKIRIISCKDKVEISHTGEIGEFIDLLLEANADEVIDLGNDSTALYLRDDYYIVGVSNDEKTSWRRILEVSRHPAHGGMVTVKTRSGRKTTATLSHSFLKRTKEGSIVPIEGSNLKLGDRIPVTRYIPTIENPLTTTKINRQTYTLDKDFGWIIGAYLADGCAHTTVQISKVDPAFEKRLREFALAHGFTLRVYTKCVKSTFEDPRYAHKYYDGKNMSIGGAGAGVLANWFIEHFETGSYKKRIPAWVYASNKEFIAGIVSGYFDGDGNVNVEKQMIRCHSVNEGLIEDISILLNYCGVFATKLIEKRKQDKANLFHVLSVSKKYAQLYKDTIGFSIEHKAAALDEIIQYNDRDDVHSVQDMVDQIPECGESIAYIGARLKLPGQSRNYKRWLNKKAIGRRTLEKYIALFKATNDLYGNLPDVNAHITILEQAVNSNIIWDEIIELEYLPDPEEYVYDFTVPGNDSFMVDNGVLVHNTLDSFHVSGTAAAVKATSGVPRLKELLSVSRNIKTPTLQIYLKPDISSTIEPTEDNDGKVDDVRVYEAKERTLKVLKHLEITRLVDLLDSTEIFWDPPGQKGLQTNIEQDDKLLAVYREFTKLDSSKCRSSSPWVLRLCIDKTKLYRANLTMIDVYMRIYQSYGNTLECLFSDDNDAELIFQMRVNENALKDVESEDMVAALKAIEYNIVHTILLKGVAKINKVSMRPYNHVDYNKEKQQFEKINEWILDTDGSNLIEIMANINVDPYRTFTNDIYEIYNVLGIEAARNALSNEIMEVIKESSVNFRHLSLLIDTMTCKGALMSIDRHGINRGDVGPLAKSSFEETTDMLIKASIFSEYDRINGVSANIMLGQLPPCGTGDSEILLDEQEYISMVKDRINYVPDMNEVASDPCQVEALKFQVPSYDKKHKTMTTEMPEITFV